jgi:hypothetical protein
MAEELQFETARQKIQDLYANGGQDVEIRSVPYFDTAQFTGKYISGNTTSGIGWVKFSPQELVFLSKGKASEIRLGPTNVQISPAETNLAKANSTNGATHMAVEALSLARTNWRVQYASTAGFGEGNVPTDEDIVAAIGGGGAIVDPFALVVPRQFQSPAMLQDAVFQTLLKHTSVKLEFDSSRSFEIGLAELLPSGGASSMLDANGLPTNDNRYEFPEGVLWNADGNPDSELAVRLQLHRPVVVPIDLVMLPGSAVYTAPTYIYAVTRLRVHGLSIGPRGQN